VQQPPYEHRQAISPLRPNLEKVRPMTAMMGDNEKKHTNDLIYFDTAIKHQKEMMKQIEENMRSLLAKKKQAIHIESTLSQAKPVLNRSSQNLLNNNSSASMMKLNRTVTEESEITQEPGCCVEAEILTR
jgi:hypothetical protein